MHPPSEGDWYGDMGELAFIVMLADNVGVGACRALASDVDVRASQAYLIMDRHLK